MTFVQRHISDRVGSLHIAPAKFPAPLLRPYLPQLPPATSRNIILHTGVTKSASPNPSLSIHSFYSDTRLHPDPSRISIHIWCPQIIIFYSWKNFLGPGLNKVDNNRLRESTYLPPNSEIQNFFRMQLRRLEGLVMILLCIVMLSPPFICV